MQLRELEIDRFGVWKDVTFPFNERGVTVLYGPNEAGKSTLMRFIRGVLYGFQPTDERTPGPHGKSIHCGGGLRVVHRGEQLYLRRTSQPGTRGRLEINGRAASDNDPALLSLLNKTPEAVFQNIFAIGLNELQQLATLNGEEVASHIYGLSLGPEGEQILQAQKRIQSQQSQLVTADRSGEIVSLLQQVGQLDRELARVGSATQKHTALQTELSDLEDQVQTHKSRQADIEYELRGRQFLNRVWEPWKKERETARRLAALPQDDLDREILRQFDELELELSEVDEQRKGLIEDARAAQQKSELIQMRPDLEQHTCGIRNLFERSRQMQAIERSLQSHQTALEARDRQIDQLLSPLGENWDVRRIEDNDISPHVWHQLLLRADSYQTASRGRRRSIRRYKRLTTTLKKRQTEWKSFSRDFGDQSVADVRRTLTRRLHELEELRDLRLRHAHLKKTLEFVTRDLQPRVVTRQLPPFFWAVLTFFIISGFVLLGAGAYAAFHGYEGIVAGRATAWIVGGCYALLGLAVMGTSWTMKQYFETVDFRTPESGLERETLEHELRRVEQAIDRLARRHGPGATPLISTAAGTICNADADEDAIRQLRTQMAGLDKFAPLPERISRLRRELSHRRQRLQEQQRHLARVRRDWTDILRTAGLTETLKVEQALEQCRILSQVQSILKEWTARHARAEEQRKELENYRQQVQLLAEKIDGPQQERRDPHQLLAEWDRELQLLQERRKERSRLRQLAKEKRREAASLSDQMQKMRHRRGTLLKRLGVADRGEIAAKLAAIDERATLEQELKTIRDEIAAVAAKEPDLAIVEDDLERFETHDNLAAINDLKEESQELKTSLQSSYERLGAVRRQLQEVEDDRTLTSLRYEREQAAHALRQSIQDWCALRVSDQVIEKLRNRIEQNRQPGVLLAASESLRQLTCGKYPRIWTRLGEKALLVDDEHGQSLRVEQLSSGTREQVFLAVRLAMIRDFARQGTELPLILDDVTVNFDQIRTEAAVETLVDMTEQGQQVLLFTCHLHLANLFASRGMEPVWLPAQRPQTQFQH